MWVNVTNNYTVTGNFTRIIKETTKIQGLSQPTGAVISPDGKYVFVVTGYFSKTNTLSGYSSCSLGMNKCSTSRGSLTTFKRDPHDGSLMFQFTQK